MNLSTDDSDNLSGVETTGCPFCGSAETQRFKNDPWGRRQCKNCFAVGPAFKATPAGMSIKEIDKLSVSIWNIRVDLGNI